jgi:hypothetical protein
MSEETETVWILGIKGKPVMVFRDEGKALEAQEDLFLKLQRDYALENIKPTLKEYIIY